MYKEFFNLPANPFHDRNEPVFLTVGDVLAALSVTVAVTGGAYVAVKYGDDAMDYIRSKLTLSEASEQDAKSYVAESFLPS